GVGRGGELVDDASVHLLHRVARLVEVVEAHRVGHHRGCGVPGGAQVAMARRGDGVERRTGDQIGAGGAEPHDHDPGGHDPVPSAVVEDAGTIESVSASHTPYLRFTEMSAVSIIRWMSNSSIGWP